MKNEVGKLEIDKSEKENLINENLDNKKFNSEKLEDKKTNVFTKGQVLSSKRYSDRQDIISVILDEDKSYSLVEVDRLIDKFMKGKVK